MENKLILGIDFNNLLFGSYYGEKLINSKGMNVNAIKGFFFKMKTLKDMFDPDYIVISNDISRSKTFRRKLYAPYKAQRKEHDDDVLTQMKYAAQLCSLLGYPFINNELYEADDILGMVSKYADEHNMTFIAVSSDRDLYQLITDNVFIYSHKNKEIIDKQYMHDKYKLTPNQWIELKMLQGDRSDNIPGIPGVGEVTALKLMQQWGSIEGIYSHLGYLKPALREILKNNEKILPLTRELVTIITDYTKIGLTEEMLYTKEKYPNEIYSLLEELEIYSLFNIMNYSLLLDKEQKIA